MWLVHMQKYVENWKLQRNSKPSQIGNQTNKAGVTLCLGNGEMKHKASTMPR